MLRYFRGKMNIKKAKRFIPALLILQIVLCWLSSKVNLAISDGFTKWFVYNFPAMRLIDFLFGVTLGYVYLGQGENEQVDNKKQGLLYWKSITDIALVINVIVLIAVLIVYSFANPEGDLLSHSELWWRYSCLFTLLNGVLIYLLATDHGLICRLLSNKGIVFVGGISSTAFLIHQIVIRYANVLIKHISISSVIIETVIKVVVPLLLTFVTCVIWRKFYQKVGITLSRRKEIKMES